MNLLIVGSDDNFAIENYYKRYLALLGVKVNLYPLPKLADEYVNNSILLRILKKIGFSFFYKKSNLKLLESIKLSTPDIVWVFKGIEILPDTINSIKKLNIKIVNYNPDHPFIRTFSSGGNQNVEKCVPLYDLHFSYNLDLCKEINNKYGVETIFLPFGYDLQEITFKKIENFNEIKKIAFVGNPDKYRRKILLKLALEGFQIDVFGHKWEKWINHPNISTFGLISGDEFWKNLRQYRIQLNIFRPHNIGSHNMRTFEIPAVGGIMLAPESKEHSIFFNEGEEIFTYSDFDSLVQKCNMLLNMSKEMSIEIRERARLKSIKSDYTYQANSQIVYDHLKLII